MLWVSQIWMQKHPILPPVQKITERLTVCKEIPINGTTAHPIVSESNKEFLQKLVHASCHTQPSFPAVNNTNMAVTGHTYLLEHFMVAASKTSSKARICGWKDTLKYRWKNLPIMHSFHTLSFSLSWHSTCKVSTDCLLHSTHQLLCTITGSVRSEKLLPFPKPEFAASRMFFMLRKIWLACATVSPATNLFVLGSIPITPDKYTVLSITTAWLQ